MNGLELRNKVKSLYKKRAIIDTCTIIDLFELNATYLPLKIFSEVYISGNIIIEELDRQEAEELKKLGYNILNLETNRGYSLFSQLGKHYQSLSIPDRVIISIAYEKNLVCCTNEEMARKACSKIGVEYTGTLGILCCAFEYGIIDKNTFSNLLSTYESECSAYITSEIIQQIRKEYDLIHSGVK